MIVDYSIRGSFQRERKLFCGVLFLQCAVVSLTLGVKGHRKGARRTRLVMLTQQQQLQLSVRVLLVSPKLLLDLLVDPLVLSVLRRYATSSHGSTGAGRSPPWSLRSA